MSVENTESTAPVQRLVRRLYKRLGRKERFCERYFDMLKELSDVCSVSAIETGHPRTAEVLQAFHDDNLRSNGVRPFRMSVHEEGVHEERSLGFGSAVSWYLWHDHDESFSNVVKAYEECG